MSASPPQTADRRRQRIIAAVRRPRASYQCAHQRRSPQVQPVVLFITLLAFALRVYHLDAMSFWSDEGISVIRARYDFPDVLSVLPVEHVPLYFVALHQWMHAVGDGDFAVRFFSLFFSVLTLPIVYKLGEAIDERRQTADGGPQLMAAVLRPPSAVGIMAALLCAINPLQVWYAQEARMYSLVVALCAGAAWCLLRAHTLDSRRQTAGSGRVTSVGRSPSTVHRQLSIVRRPSSVYFITFALLSAAAIYTHYFAALIIVAFALWASVLVLRRALDWRPMVIAFGLIALLFVPWLPRAVAALSFPGWQATADPLSLPERYLVAYTLGTTIGDEWHWLALGFLLLIGVGTFAVARRTDARAWLPIAYVFVPFALLMLLALRKPGYHERYLIVITPMLFVVMAVGLDTMRHAYSVIRNQSYASRITNYGLRITHPASRIVPILAFAAVLVASALSLNNLYFDARFAKPDYRTAAQYVDQLSRQGDGLIFDGPDPLKAFYRYFSRQRVSAFDEISFDPQDEVEAAAFLTRHTPEHQRWWVVLYFHTPGPTEDWLLQHGYLASSRWFNGIRVLLYATPSESALRTSAPESVQTELPLQLVNVRVLPNVQAGDVLPIIVQWRVTSGLASDYQASVRLLDTNGNKVKQLDRRPLDGRVPTSQWQIGEVIEDRYGLLVPDDALDARYAVEIRLYQPEHGDVLVAHLTSVDIVSKP